MQKSTLKIANLVQSSQLCSDKRDREREMASMQLQDIRAMGEALTKAREMCEEAQFEKGLQLYQETLQTLRQFIRRMQKMAERQPWLQVNCVDCSATNQSAC